MTRGATNPRLIDRHDSFDMRASPDRMAAPYGIRAASPSSTRMDS